VPPDGSSGSWPELPRVPGPGPSLLFHTSQVYGLSKNFAASTDFHLLGPTPLRLSPADCPIDKPAEVPQVKFPRRADFPNFRRTVPNIPTGAEFPARPAPIGYQKERLPFDVHRDLAPSLFKALHGLEGGSEKSGHLLLGLPEFLAHYSKFLMIQVNPPSKPGAPSKNSPSWPFLGRHKFSRSFLCSGACKKSTLDKYTTMWYLESMCL
jgi:hypothetical protein